MNLAEYQRALIADSFALGPGGQGEIALGNPERFRLYRQMIRARLLGMAQVAFKQSLASCGERSFAACFERYLAHHPPRSPLIRDVIAAFGAYAREDRQLLAEASAQLPDMLSFERAKWTLAYRPCARPKLGQDGVRELDFEGALVLNPVLELLRLAHPVHTAVDTESIAKAETALLVYRPDGIDEVRWYVAEPLFAEIVRLAGETEAPLAGLVRSVAEQQGRVLDEELLEALASSLTLALQRGVVVGVRPAARAAADRP